MAAGAAAAAEGGGEAAGPLRRGKEGAAAGAPQAGEREGAAGLPAGGGGSRLPGVALPEEMNSNNSGVAPLFKFVKFWGIFG